MPWVFPEPVAGERTIHFPFSGLSLKGLLAARLPSMALLKVSAITVHRDIRAGDETLLRVSGLVQWACMAQAKSSGRSEASIVVFLLLVREVVSRWELPNTMKPSR
jgi:hypothetical protein